MTRPLFTLFGVVALAGACKKDATFEQPLTPKAPITWLNAISDTGQLDLRVVDIPTNASFMDADFRSAQPFPQGIEAGTRRIKVFRSSTDPAVAQLVLVDTTFTFDVAQRYGFYVTGLSRTGSSAPKQALIVTIPPAPTMGATQFAIRVLNLAPSLAGSIRPLADTTTPADAFLLRRNVLASGTAPIQNVAYLGASGYAVVDTGRYRLALTASGTADPSILEAIVPPGDVGNPTNTPIAGSLVPGSVLTAIIVPRSVPASTAPQTRPASRATDTTVAEAAQRITRSGDTVTVQVGSVRVLTNRRGTVGTDPVVRALPDSTLSGTGTRASAGLVAGDLILVSGAAQAEYNGWHEVLAVADTLSCTPPAAGDNQTRCAPPADTTVVSSDTAFTRFRFRYRVVGAPATPGSGTVVFRVYPASYFATDFVTPQVIFVVDRRP